MRLLDIWINCPDRGTARAIADDLIARRLAACANIYPAIESLYRWQGRIEKADETPLLIKTRAEHFEAVAAAARALHPDEVPAIHALEAAAVLPDYLAWVEDETATPDRAPRPPAADPEPRPASLDDHPLLNTPSLTALILRTAADGPAGVERIARRLDAVLEAADEHPPVPGSDLRRHLQALCDELAIAGLLAHSAGRYTLTNRGAQALAEHPDGLDRADLTRWPEYAAHVRRLAARPGARDDPHASAYDQGVAACLAGRPVTDNPHSRDTADHLAWESGWSEAHGR